MKVKDERKKMTDREPVRMNLRAFQLWWKTNPNLFVSTALYMLFGSLTPYVSMYFVAQLLNEIAGGQQQERLLHMLFSMITVTFVLTVAGAALLRWKNTVYAVLWQKHTRIYSQKMMSMDFSAMEDPHTRELYYRIQQETGWSNCGLLNVLWQFEGLARAVVGICASLALSISLFTFQVPEGSSLSFLNSPVFLVGMFAVMIGATCLSPWLSNKQGNYWISWAEEAKFGNRVFGFYGFMGKNDLKRALDIRTYRQEILCRQKWKFYTMFGEDCGIAKCARGPMGLYAAAASMVSQIFTGIVYLFVCLKAWGGAFGIGSVTQYIGAITSLSGNVSELLRVLGEMKTNAAFLKTAFELLDMPNEMYKGSLTVEKRSDSRYDVEFRDVSFRYPGSGLWALRHVSMKFQVGERLAVVGPNGSGKTTMIKLLCRLYDPTEGVILLNGIDIRKYDYKEYMSIFSVVFQDFQLLDFGLGQNVAGGVHYDAERAEKCLQDAGFGDRLKAMQKGLETYIGKGFDKEGVSVSGGEAQKIAIARAIYRDVPFIVLDEPTAALDPLAESEIYESFNRLIQDKTAIYISHRLSSCKFCDRIAVFDQGSVVQFGTHEELLSEKGGKYQELWNAQAQYYT